MRTIRLQWILATISLAALLLAGVTLPAQTMDVKTLEKNMPPVELVAASKMTTDSEKGNYRVHVGKVPGTSGWAVFPIHVMDKGGAPLDEGGMVHAVYEMPGMEMKLPEVRVERVNAVEWRLALPIFGSGSWRITLHIKENGAMDTAHFDFKVP